MTAADIMTAAVVTVAPQTPIVQVAQTLLNHGISGVPVVEDGNILGVVSEGDLVRRLVPEAPRGVFAAFHSRHDLAHEYLRNHGAIAGDVMTAPAITVDADTPVSEVAMLMERHGIKRLPVLDGEGRIIGMVTRANMLRALLAHAPDTHHTDGEIRRALVLAFADNAWASSLDPSGVTVSGGVVHLWGPVKDPELRRALVAAAGEVPYVKGVVDHMTDA